jgi:hypothetical protein
MAAAPDLQTLVARIESALSPTIAAQQRMFGGVTFLVNGNMLCCASRKGLMVRVGAAAEAKALAFPHARPCRETGRPMPGFILIAAEGFARDSDLARWLSMARAYVDTLPPKAIRASKGDGKIGSGAKRRAGGIARGRTSTESSGS